MADAAVQPRGPLIHLGHPQGHIPMFDPPDVPSKPVARRWLGLILVLGTLGALLGWFLEHAGKDALPPDVAVGWVIPFALLLACIAIMPFLARHFWEHYYPHVAIGLGAIVAAYYLLAFQGQGARALARSLGEYVSFIYLLGSLFVVSGGILIRVRRTATPLVNVVMLLTGAILANVFGTTGASMLLIRPYLRINAGHIRPYHVVFFIFIVSNLGGALTPIGDPPLFLGYLKGVPFWWVAEHCWPMWVTGIALLLAAFFILDTRENRRGPRVAGDTGDLGPAVSVYGAGNVVFIALVLAGVFMHPPVREILMTVAVVGSLWATPRRIHQENVFNYAPIREVALLFVGIFATMVPALNYLSNHAHDKAFERFLRTPGQFYFTAGGLSSVLDNAPTYLTFLETGIGKLDKNLVTLAREIADAEGKDAPNEQVDRPRLRAMNPARYANAAAFEADWQELRRTLDALKEYHGDKLKQGKGALSRDEVEVGFLLGDERLNWYLVATSLGAVFFGAMTYIGNGPNFMVKSIAENAGVKCPGFFAYLLLYAVPILLPVLLLVWAIFLRPHAGI